MKEITTAKYLVINGKIIRPQPGYELVIVERPAHLTK